MATSEHSLRSDDDVAKPLLRGVLHQHAAIAALAAGLVMAATAPTTRATLGGLIFSASMLLCFSISATYHRVQWSTVARARMRRADHASIFLLIAGTYTPFAMVGLPDPLSTRLLITVWGAALLGSLQSIFWIKAPKPLTAFLAVAAGW